MQMSKKSSVVLSVAAAVLAAAAIFLGVPAIIYGGNDGEFLWPFNNILATYWPWATGLAALLVAPALALPAKWARRWAAAATVLATYAWAHGVFQTHKFGDIDGRDWSAAVPAWQSVVEAVVLLAAIVAVWVLAHRAQRPAAGLQLFLAAGLVLQAWPAISESEWRAISDETRMTEAATFSTEANALIVLMD